MLPLSFLVEVHFTVPLPMSFHATVKTRSLVIAVLLCQICFHLLFPFAPFGGKSYLPLLVGPTNKEDLGLFLLKVPLGSSKDVQHSDLSKIFKFLSQSVKFGSIKRLASIMPRRGLVDDIFAYRR